MLLDRSINHAGVAINPGDRLTGGGKASQQRGVVKWPYRTVTEASPFKFLQISEWLMELGRRNRVAPEEVSEFIHSQCKFGLNYYSMGKRSHEIVCLFLSAVVI